MCGRFTLTTADYHTVAQALEAEVEAGDAQSYRPRFNVAPTDPHPVVVLADGHRRMQWGKWGMAAPWDRGKDKPSVHINARAETMARKGLYKSAFIHRRCVVPADGFFEWEGPKSERLPIWYHPPEAIVIPMAGLFTDHRDKNTGEVTRTFSIVTCEPNRLVAPVHDRMPLILDPADIDLWLAPAPGKDDPEGRDAFGASLLALAVPAAEDRLLATPVSRRANDVKNDDAACLTPRQ